jgi:dTMP kinase
VIISFSGIDGSGKSTHVEMLRAFLDKANIVDVDVLHFPVYDSPTGQIIKKMLSGSLDFENAVVLQSLMTVNRLEQFNRLLQYDISGNVLILDRYNACAVAYGQADGLSYQWLEDIHADFPKAGFNFLFDIPVEESFKRRPKRTDMYESDRKRLEKVRDNYLKLFINRSDHHVIDGMQTKESIHKQVVAILEGAEY